jgi:nickel-dependent lactate racemase
MKTGVISFGTENVKLNLPDFTDILAMPAPEPLREPEYAIQTALTESIGSPGLDSVIREKLRRNPGARAVVVVSDNTRPVPYKGKTGILWPVVAKLLNHGFTNDRILILVATGTHHALSDPELRTMLDSRVYEAGIPVKNHDCQDTANLADLGRTRRGSQILINRHYVEADLKILTGLVESHFMAGVSGGRKSICPGLIGESGTYTFHSAPLLASPNARDLVLEGNPCHEEALEFARRAGADYIINVTLDHHFKLTGVFAGDLEAAHRSAVERLKEYVALPVAREYDIVITHAGFVGINHYQAAKAGVAAAQILKPGGRLILAANNTDAEPLGSLRYRTVLQLFKLIGAERFQQLINSAGWTFIPEQWQVQMWAKLYAKVAPEHFIYYSPGLQPSHYELLPAVDGNRFLPETERYQGTLARIAKVVTGALDMVTNELKQHGVDRPSLAFLQDGPYGIPVFASTL